MSCANPLVSFPVQAGFKTEYIIIIIAVGGAILIALGIWAYCKYCRTATNKT